jgi:hypothetical protein
MAGISPAAAGFRSVDIRPYFGELQTIKGNMPHPDGEISWDYKKLENNQLDIKIALPPTMGGTFYWQGQTRTLHSGNNEFRI